MACAPKLITPGEDDLTVRKLQEPKPIVHPGGRFVGYDRVNVSEAVGVAGKAVVPPPETQTANRIGVADGNTRSPSDSKLNGGR